jgi:hypothetical protein
VSNAYLLQCRFEMCQLASVRSTSDACCNGQRQPGSSSSNQRQGRLQRQRGLRKNLDLVVQLGWAHVEARCMGYMLDEVR